MEMSRQRIRTSVLESSTEKCPYCGGSGHVRSVSSLALQLLRALEEQLMKGATHNLIVRTRPDVALYVLNHKRAHLRALEERFAITVTIAADETVTAPQAFAIDRGEQVHTLEAARGAASNGPRRKPLRRSRKKTTWKKPARWKAMTPRRLRRMTEPSKAKPGAAAGGAAAGVVATAEKPRYMRSPPPRKARPRTLRTRRRSRG